MIKLFTVGAVASGAAIAALLLIPATHAKPLVELSAAEAAPPLAVLDAYRIAEHLEQVEVELRARDVTDLSEAQQAARSVHLDRLREYRISGVFPRNHDFPAGRVPYFMDRNGTRCAMAELIHRSGEEALVAEIAARRNNAYIAELASDPRLIAWLDAAGLTVEEAARIQPAYGWIPAPEPEPQIRTGYAVASGVAAGMSGAAIALAFTAPADQANRGRGAFAIAAGAAGMALGAARLDDGGAPATLGAVNVGIGFISMATGVRTLFAAPRDRVAPTNRHTVQAEVAPLVSATDPGAAGFAINLRF